MRTSLSFDSRRFAKEKIKMFLYSSTASRISSTLALRNSFVLATFATLDRDTTFALLLRGMAL